MQYKRIMFVCLGNICRSQMAQCVFTQMAMTAGLDVTVDSAGTSDEEEGNPIYPAAARQLREEGVPVLRHLATKLEASDYDKWDVFFAMEQRNVSGMLRIFGGDPQDKIIRLLDLTERPRDIADPWWTGDFDRAYADICEGCSALLETFTR